MISSLIIALLMICVSDAGETYIRWGRSVCPTGTHRLYKGYMAGGYHTVSGNGANYVCAHEDPKFLRPVAGMQEWTGQIYGVEMENWQAPLKGLFSAQNIASGTVNDQDMVCVICYVADATTKIMVTGRPDCGETGFDLQYFGFLVSNVHGGSQYRGEYICIDEAPEGRTGGSADNNQALVYPVQVGCGSLPCTPYVEGYEMTCAICTY